MTADRVQGLRHKDVLGAAQIVGEGDEKQGNELIEERRVMAMVWGPDQPPTTLVSSCTTSRAPHDLVTFSCAQATSTEAWFLCETLLVSKMW